jgi:Coenzyme PQQ synthesis protein D (PqqD)
MAKQFRVTGSNVMSETIDGEVIVINLATGTYYSLRDAAAATWSLVERGATAEDVAAALETRYDGSQAAILEAVQRFLSDLEHEELVASTNEQNGAGEWAALPEEAASARRPFQAPVLEKYTDMQELILLDPVHEVGAAGWPHRPGEGTDSA